VFVNFPAAVNTTVDFATMDGTPPGNNSAAAPGDYATTTGTVTILAGNLSATTAPIPVVGDGTVENNERFTVNLSNPLPAGTTIIAPGTSTVLILDDDGAPSLSVGDVSVVEGNPPGGTTATFVVTLSTRSSLPVTFDFATADGTAFVAQGDYTAT